MFFKLAFSNIWRNKRRTLFTEITIIFGILIIVFVSAFTNGISRGWAIGMIESYNGAIQIEHRDYEKEHKFKPLKTTLSNSSKLIQAAESFPKVTAAYGLLKIEGMISNGSKTSMFFGQAVDIEGKLRALPLAEESIGEGRNIKPGSNEAVVGPKLAENLGVKIGDSLMVLTRTMHGGLNMVELVIVGLLNVSGGGVPDVVSAHFVEMDLNVAQKLLRMPDRVSQIVLGFEEFDEIKAATPLIQQKLDQVDSTPLVAKDYEKLIPGFGISNFFNLIGLVIGTILFIIVGAGIANAMFMSVMERRREIGTMKAIGTEQGQIKRLFLYEGIIIGFVGIVVGLIVSIIVVFLVNQLGGVPLPPPPGTSESISILTVINWNTCIYSAFLTFIVSSIAAWIPAAVSSKLDPVVTLREE